MAEEDLDINRLFEPEQRDALEAYLRLLHPADIAELFNYVKPERWVQITQHLTPEALAEVLTHLEDPHLEDLSEAIGTDRLAEAIGELETDDAVDVLAELSDEKSEALLERLEDKEELEALMAYPEDSAGGIMQTEVCVVPEGKRVTDAIEEVRKMRDIIDDIHEVYVVDGGGHLVGAVALEDLVLSRDDTRLADIRYPIEVTVPVSMDQEEVATLFLKYDVASAPVVDAEGRLLGRITFDDVHDVLEEEATEDIMTMAGSSGEELVYSGAIFRITAFRLPWLLTSLMGMLIASQLNMQFGRLGESLIFSAFVPVVMAMTGNVGSQSAMIITRGIALGKVDIGALGRTFLREMSVGLLMGICAGSVVSVYGWLLYDNANLGLTLGLSMIASMSWASAVGTGAPAIFKHLGIDPAVAAGPLITTGCDVMGVAIYLGMALLLT